MKLINVTVTGADDSIDPQALLEIQAKYPYAEFGILLSDKDSNGPGTTRFPSRKWLRQLVQVDVGHTLNLSGHLCGAWVRGFLTGHLPDFDRIASDLQEHFSRFQINTHAEPHEHDAGLYDLLNFLRPDRQTIIFQLDGRDGTAIAQEAIAHGWTEGIAGLFDLSHGSGVLPKQWPEPIPGLQCGYAGGLSPENVAGQLKKLCATANGDTWIDAETHLFNNGKFDLGRVEMFLEAAKPYVK